MKFFVFVIALLSLFSALIPGQGASAQTGAPAVKSVAVGAAYDGKKLGGVATTFSPKTRKIFSVMTLRKLDGGGHYKAVWIAVDAGGMKNYAISEYQAPNMPVNPLQSSLSLPRDWPVGKYRVEWTRDNKPFRTVAFSVK